MVLKIHELSPVEGSRKKRKRVGRGLGSGHGKTACRGNKGQKCRSGGTTGRGFEGGQMPLYRRLPKRGFSNYLFKKHLEVVNVGQLNDFEDGTTVTPALLVERGLIRGKGDGVKILSDGELKIKLTIEAHRFSQKAKEKIEQAQGTCKEI